MTETAVLEALAEAHEAAASVLRRHAAQLQPRPVAPRPDGNLLERVRQILPSPGHRQLQVVTELARAGEAGATTGTIATAIDYVEPNVYNTLTVLVRRGIAVKDMSVWPYRYRLARELRDGNTSDSAHVGGGLGE